MSRPNPYSPLTADHLTQIQNALDVIHSAEYEVDRAKRAGIDVSSHEAQLKDAKDKLQRLKSVYFPNHP